MSAENDTAAWWAGSWGDEYTKRNRIDWRARIPFWKRIINETGARSVYEIGCNVGYNLSAIQRTFPDIQVYGEDVNHSALNVAEVAGLDVHEVAGLDVHLAGDGYINNGDVELVFTAGVLIHTDPADLPALMQRVVDLSHDYVLAIEYEGTESQEVVYRGNEQKLWRNDFGKLYQEMGLTLIEKFDAGEGFDNCTAWLLRK